MVVDLGESEIFKRKMAQAIHGLIGSDRAIADLLEKLADGFSVQEALSG